MKWISVATVATLLAGCQSLASHIAEPRTRISTTEFVRGVQATFPGQFQRRELDLADGRRLAWIDVQPASYLTKYAFSGSPEAGRFSFNFAFKSPGGPPQALPVQGTVIYLHPWWADSGSMLPWAVALAGEGYRGLAVDLRNHGRSSRAPAGYGPREAEDIVALVRRLREQESLVEPLYLFGISFGAAAALHASAALGEEVAGTVAIAPFDRADDAIHGAVAAIQKNRKGFYRLLPRYDADEVGAGLAEAGRRLDLDLSQVRTSDAVPHLRNCTLLVSAGRDGYFSPEVAASLAAGSPRVVHVELSEDTHETVSLRFDRLRKPLLQWLAESRAATAEAPCPALALAPAEDTDERSTEAAGAASPGRPGPGAIRNR